MARVGDMTGNDVDIRALPRAADLHMAGFVNDPPCAAIRPVSRDARLTDFIRLAVLGLPLNTHTFNPVPNRLARAAKNPRECFEGNGPFTPGVQPLSYRTTTKVC